MDFSFSEMFTHWVLQAIAMAITAMIIPRLEITSLFGALSTVLALALVNATLWDAALFFSVPNSLTSHAFILFLANGVLFWVLVKLLPGIEVEGVLPAILAPIVFTALSLIISKLCQGVDLFALLKLAFHYIQDLKQFFLDSTP